MTHLQERKREREQEFNKGKDVDKTGEDRMEIDVQNEVTVGVANGEGHSSPILGSSCENGTKHFSKKIRAENLNS